MVVLTCVDGALRDTSAGSCAAARDMLDALARTGVPVVLASHPDAYVTTSTGINGWSEALLGVKAGEVTPDGRNRVGDSDAGQE